MKLVTVFRFCLYALSAFAAWILGRAEGGWIPYITFPVIAAACMVTETKAQRTISGGLANLFGAMAVAAAAWEFQLPNDEAKLLSGAHLLVYATWIVMFQEKTYRLYWWVMALGVLQVAVASVLQPGPWYGVCLMIYICAALATMSIASLYQVQQQFEPEEEGWKWDQEALAGPAGTVMVRPSIQHDESQQWLTRRFFGGQLVLIAMSLVVTAAFFALTPRVWFGPRSGLGEEVVGGVASRQGMTGFARDVRLGDMGPILESVEPVLSVHCRDARTDETVSLDTVAQRLGMDEALFRGAVMTEYENGRWMPERHDQPVKLSRVFNRAGYVQEITLEGKTDEVLFCVGTPQAIEMTGRREDVYVQLSTGIVTRESRSENRQRATYRAYVTSVSQEQADLRAAPMPSGIWWQDIERSYLERTADFNARDLPRLAALVSQRLTQLEERLGHPPERLEICRDFEQYLQSNGGFGYTLNLTVQDRNIDPVEDFLFNRKEGHCEYFASALTLMLRAAGIPARLVSGFKGAEYSRLRGSWDVQERHSHAWVEAWTEENFWITLDPTPFAARDESVKDVSSKLGFWGRFRSSGSSIWQDYVVNVNLRQQQETVYGPVKNFFQKLVGFVKAASLSWRSMVNQWWEILTNPSEWFSTRGGLVTFTFLLGVALIVRGVWSLVNWIRRGGWKKWIRATFQTRVVVQFYQRFLQIVQKKGWHRDPAQTPLEFAESVATKLKELHSPAIDPSFPSRISSAFYRVRFGGELLEDAELADLEARLQSLEAALQPTGR